MGSESLTSSRRKIVTLTAALAIFSLLLISGVYAVDQDHNHGILKFTPAPANVTHHRKLLNDGNEKYTVVPNRIYSETCSKSDIVISQGQTEPLPNGIPTYTVEIMNVCVSGCDISNIHFSCGWFSSARLVNPRVFKRLQYDDCLVNEGEPLANGHTLSFQYASTYSYPIAVSSMTC